MGQLAWQETLDKAIREAQRSGEFKGGLTQPVTLAEFVSAAAERWEVEKQYSDSLKKFHLHELNNQNLLIRSEWVEVASREDAEELADRLCVAFDSSGHCWIVGEEAESGTD